MFLIIIGMTVLDATILLYGWFEENTSFKLESDFKKINPISESPEEDKAAIECGLREMLECKFIDHHNDYWILNRPIHSIEQSVTLSAPTALQIANVINTFCTVSNIKQNECNPSQISEKDLNNLLFICHTLSGEDDKEFDNEGS